MPARPARRCAVRVTPLMRVGFGLRNAARTPQGSRASRENGIEQCKETNAWKVVGAGRGVKCRLAHGAAVGMGYRSSGRRGAVAQARCWCQSEVVYAAQRRTGVVQEWTGTVSTALRTVRERSKLYIMFVEPVNAIPINGNAPANWRQKCCR